MPTAHRCRNNLGHICAATREKSAYTGTIRAFIRIKRRDMRKLWLIFIAIIVGSFGILGWIGSEIFRQSPPIPLKVVTTDGRTMIAEGDVSEGQNVWQAMGGMQVGSIWGHGSYVAPEWTA